MFPEFLEEFKEGLEKYKLDCINIIATPLAEGESTEIKQSKFSGVPYLPVGMEYPRDSNNLPMVMLAQINFEEVPFIDNYPSRGIIQFFVTTNWIDIDYDVSNDRNIKVLYHDNLETDYQTDFSFLTDEMLIHSPIVCEHKLNFVKKRSMEELKIFVSIFVSMVWTGLNIVSN